MPHEPLVEGSSEALKKDGPTRLEEGLRDGPPRRSCGPRSCRTPAGSVRDGDRRVIPLGFLRIPQAFLRIRKDSLGVPKGFQRTPEESEEARKRRRGGEEAREALLKLPQAFSSVLKLSSFLKRSQAF